MSEFTKYFLTIATTCSWWMASIAFPCWLLIKRSQGVQFRIANRRPCLLGRKQPQPFYWCKIRHAWCTNTWQSKELQPGGSHSFCLCSCLKCSGRDPSPSSRRGKPFQLKFSQGRAGLQMERSDGYRDLGRPGLQMEQSYGYRDFHYKIGMIS